MNTNLDNLSADDLRRAADLRDQIEQLQSELEQLLSGKKKPGRKAAAGRAAKKTAKKRPTRKISAASRKKMSEKRKAYWAAKRKEKAKAAKAAK